MIRERIFRSGHIPSCLFRSSFSRRYSYIGRFSGEASFYNEKTGTYDPVDIRKQDFTREELSDYIAADGKITVRYSGGNDVENGTSQALPLLMVTGREN